MKKRPIINTTSGIMRCVIVALLPGLSLQYWWFGNPFLCQCLLSVLTALAAEWLCLTLRDQPVLPRLYDLSAVVTALLLAASLPSDFPMSLTCLGTAWAIILAKHCYGGIGHNIFNPAMVAYALLLLSFPQAMTAWPSPPLTEIDAITEATPLDQHKQIVRYHSDITPSTSAVPNWQLILSAAWSFGGLMLWLFGLIPSALPCGVIAGVLLCATIIHWLTPLTAIPLAVHVFSGSTLFGAWFIVTDPVTASTTPLGRWIYALLVGCMTVIIRHNSHFPDGFAFAILLANALVPLIDKVTLPVPFGRHHVNR